MKVLTVIGNRPQFIKAAAVSPLLADELLVHTGQHHDDRLSRIFFDELGIPEPAVQLGVAGGSNTSQTARQLAALEPVLAESDADVVLVYGDTNSTLAGALAASQAGVPVAHVEAGMRSYDRAMPEEVNRVLVDHLSSLLLCSSRVGIDQLRAEGVVEGVVDVGDVMVDTALRVQASAASRSDLLVSHGVAPGGYVLATAHRAGNVDSPERLAALVALLNGVAAEVPVLLPLHPRTRSRMAAAGLSFVSEVRVCEPLGYVELNALLCGARAALTDSGGLQKEAYLAGVPCITMRPSTEWVETVEAGWNTLVDLSLEAALSALSTKAPAERPPLYGDGRAGERVVAALAERFG
ncbi:MAG: UDP-N-acetylglucosamine 2-epimerase (non-hydrolyzing) [Solirubrobacterales bacterium]|nr:UDP-N-acetylglucosamine 2-epimerase (non-hydrolyzing) [Solirubrobacterales bacterium]